MIDMVAVLQCYNMGMNLGLGPLWGSYSEVECLLFGIFSLLFLDCPHIYKRLSLSISPQFVKTWGSVIVHGDYPGMVLIWDLLSLV